MALTELAARQAKPGDKTLILSDGRGLILEVRPNGRKYWIARIWVGGKEKRRSLGCFPEVSLKNARDLNYELRRSLGAGGLPDAERETFGDVAAEWLEKRAKPKFSDSYMRTVLLRMNKYILPEFGGVKLGDVSSGARRRDLPPQPEPEL